MKTHYDLLGLAPNASADQIKAAFRREVSRYHPDKVAHLGPELQDLAAQRTAELTAAYNVLSREERRQEYDVQLQQFSDAGQPAPAARDRSAPPSSPSDTSASSSSSGSSSSSSSSSSGASSGSSGGSESGRTSQLHVPDVFLKRASLAHLRETLDAEENETVEFRATGFDLAAKVRPRRGFFQKAGPPMTVVARMAVTVDGPAVEETWTLASRVPADAGSVLCVMLMGTGIASASDLGAIIARERRRRRPSSAAIVLAPIDVRDWHALVPSDAPPAFKTLLEKLRVTNR